MFYLSNAFSINMFSTFPKERKEMIFEPISLEVAREKVAAILPVMTIGHPDTAYNAAVLLGMPEHAENWATLAKTRYNLKLGKLDILLVIQYRGERLKEGTTELPTDAELEFWLVYENW